MSELHSIRTRSEPAAEPALLAAFARSAVYSALALGFEPPGPEVRERLASSEGAVYLAEALAAAGCGELAASARALAGEAPRESAYRRLFGHTARGSVPPYGTEYGAATLFQQPQRLADLGGFFAAFGLRVDPARHERVDHVRCQLEFLAFLARKEAHARDAGGDRMLAEVERGQRLFLRDHLGKFAPAFGERLRRAEGTGFYGVLGGLLRAFVEAECGRCGVSAGPENLVLRLTEDLEVPIACGSDGCLPGGSRPP